MKNIIEIIKKLGAADVGIIPYTNSEVVNPNLENRLGFTPQTVIIGTVPYYTHFCDEHRTVSAYALAYDYHKLLHRICNESIDELSRLYPEAHFKGFADHSPINEKLAAARAGLGIIGDHSLLITEKHSSFVFLFEIITDLKTETPTQEIRYCEHCGACKSACPSNIDDKTTCLSAITQKKGELTEKEMRLIASSGYVWGCDICQLVCPHTKKAISEKSIYTNSSWFNSNIITEPTEITISDAVDFSNRAYSWRGKQTILRNISIQNIFKEP